MTSHYPDTGGPVILIGLGHFPLWHAQSEALPISGKCHACHQYSISALFAQTSSHRETSGGKVKGKGAHKWPELIPVSVA